MTFEINLNVRSYDTVTGESKCTLIKREDLKELNPLKILTKTDIVIYDNNSKKSPYNHLMK